MKAFAGLENIVPSPEVTEGKLAACVGVFQQVVAGKLPKYVSRFDYSRPTVAGI